MSEHSVFVFGSNLAGRHGAGAALHAKIHCGAEWGVGEGPTGESYAIPTMDALIQPRPLEDIRVSVRRFMVYAAGTPALTYQVTPVGCGLAGFNASQIAPMFAGAPRNCQLPDGWRVMNGEQP
jgi:hypothetical protein